LTQHSGNLVEVFYLTSRSIPDGSIKVQIFNAMFILLLTRDKESALPVHSIMAKKYQWVSSAWKQKRRGQLFEWLDSNGRHL